MLALKTQYNYYRPFLLIALTSLPLFIATLFGPLAFIPLITIGSVFLLYDVTAKLQAIFFNYDKREAFLYLIFPLQVLIVFWGMLLVKRHRFAVFTQVVCILLALILYAIAPILRRDRQRRVRLISYRYGYTAFGLLVVLSQLTFFLRVI